MKKYTLTNLDFNEVCFLQQSVRARIEHYQDKLVKTPKDKTYVKAEKDLKKAVERINTLHSHLSEKEIMWVMSLLTFEKLLDIVKDSKEFENYTNTMKERTIN